MIKQQITNNNQDQMFKSAKTYDLEERTFEFAKNCTTACRKLSKTISNIEYVKQLTRSSGSVGANYIEANEALSKKDFLMRIKICRKEAKESAYWLRLISVTNDNTFPRELTVLLNEAIELKKIFSAILNKG